MSGQIDNSTSEPLLQRLGRSLGRPLTAQDRSRAVLHLIDWLGCAAAGAAGAASTSARKAMSSEPLGVSSLLGAGQTNASNAAFLNGLLGNVLEMDDVDKRGTLHPGPSIIPAALALAQQVDADGPALLEAIVRGYEATVRLGRAVGPHHYANWHNTGTCGSIGAAAACASLLGLSGHRLTHALALGASQATGFWATRHEPRSMGKQLHTAHAARAGLDAARLASEGFEGPLSLLEGRQGFFAATCGDADPEKVMADYGAEWLIHQISFKPWPACRHAHAAIDAALKVGEQVGTLDPACVRSVSVETYPDAIAFCDRPSPGTVIEAKFSLQHSVAVSLLRGRPTLADFEPATFREPTVQALASKVSVLVGEAYRARYPARFGAGVRLDLADGSRFACEMPDAWGDPEWPLTQEDILAKAEMLMIDGAGLTPSTAEAALDAAKSLAKASDLAGLTAALAAWRIGELGQ